MMHGQNNIKSNAVWLEEIGVMATARLQQNERPYVSM